MEQLPDKKTPQGSPAASSHMWLHTQLHRTKTRLTMSNTAAAGTLPYIPQKESSFDIKGTRPQREAKGAYNVKSQQKDEEDD
eukprot:6320459-Amphidinium_carterae.1